MRVKLGNWINRMLVSPLPDPAPTDKGWSRFAGWLAAGAFAAWIFAYKMGEFLGLATTSDLYCFVQWSTIWPGKGFYHDNYFGNVLSIHSYLLCPLLGVFSGPLGAFGLLAVVALAGGLTVCALTRILRCLRVPRWWALLFGLAIAAMPLSVHIIRDEIYGFHLELLEPAIALWLTYFLVQRSWLGAGLTACALIGVKEDAPLLAMAVAAAVLLEDLLRGWLGPRGAEERVSAWNRPAVAVLGLGALSVPVLLFVISTQQTATVAVNLERLRPETVAGIENNRELFGYVLANVRQWFESPPVATWLGLAAAATLGLVVLRPHLTVLGLVTTLVAWLMRDDLIWAPRFVQAMAFFQVVTCFGLGSAWQIIADLRQRGAVGRWAAGIAIFVIVGIGAWAMNEQLRIVPESSRFYRFEPKRTVTVAERQAADRLYAAYRDAGRRTEPVLASNNLFRYAHDRNLLWPQALRGRPQPEWILWDADAYPLSLLATVLRIDAASDLSDYRLLGQAERFRLYRRKAEAELARERAEGRLPAVGDDFGQVRLRIKLAEAEAGRVEPILSIGTRDRGQLFYLRRLGGGRAALGYASVEGLVEESDPFPVEVGGTYDVELFAGSLLPPAGATSGDEALSPEARLALLQRVVARWNGRLVVKAMSGADPAGPDDVRFGVNRVRVPWAGERFQGKILDVARGGYPDLSDAGATEFGAVRLQVELPDVAGGAAEPLVVIGLTGEAHLAYVRTLGPGSIRVGVEIWSIGAWESEPIAVSPTGPVEIEVAMPGLFPPEGDARWLQTPPAIRRERLQGIRIAVNGETVLTQAVHAPALRVRHPVYGVNPLGGSWVAGRFNGRILSVERQRLVPDGR